MSIDWDKYKTTCGDCACYFSCKKAEVAGQSICKQFVVEEDDVEQV